jgi:uncharacterized membrane protein YbhN (UPF0104 family)
MLGGRFTAAAVLLQRADRTSAGVAAVCFVTTLAATSGAWRAAFGASGASLGRLDSFSRYGAGSLVNTFMPARLGDGLRLALFTRTLPPAKWRVLAAGSSVAAVGAAGCLMRLVLLGALVLLGLIPLWPVFALGGLLLVAFGTVVAVRRRAPKILPEALRASIAALTRCPLLALRLLGWKGLEAAARVCAAAAVASSLGVARPFATALLIMAVVDVASVVPVTPGNVGITSGAIAVALHSQGTGISTALAAGVAYHAIQSLVGISCGLAAVGLLATSARRRRLVPAHQG